MPRSIIRIDPILPGRMNDKILDKILRQATREEIRGAVKDMKAYVSTWKDEDKPKWSIRSKKTARSYETRMTTRDQPFVWVEVGTSKRFRRMSAGFRAKTRPGSLTPRPGSGKAEGFYKTARPGIKARNNLETMAKLRGNAFVTKTQIKINAAVSTLFT